MKQTIFRVFMVGGAALAITFPTTATSLGNETTNTQIVVPNTTNTLLLAANPARKFALIKNNSGSTVYLSVGGNASAATFLALLNGESFSLNPSTLGAIAQGLISAWHNAGGPLNVNVMEF